MAYTPVPAVAADDWIDEIFINTYWVDNMAASVPDVFSAKGQLPVGLGVDSMGILNVGANGTILSADSAEPTGLKWIPRPAAVSFFPANVSVGGKGTGMGTYTIDADVHIPGVPSDAIAVLLIGNAQWTDVSLNPIILIEMSVGNNAIALYGQVNNKVAAGAGIVPLTASGTFIVRVLVANAAVFSLFCLGYLR